MEKKLKHINKLIYYFSLLTWIVNICFIFIPFFFNVSRIWIVGIFVSVLIQGIVSGAFGDETAIPDTRIKRKFLDYCLIISGIASAVFAILSGITLSIVGGGPEIIDGSYYIVNNGDIVRQISSSNWFVFFCICDILLSNCGILIFSSIMALRIRKLYQIQKQ